MCRIASQPSAPGTREVLRTVVHEIEGIFLEPVIRRMVENVLRRSSAAARAHSPLERRVNHCCGSTATESASESPGGRLGFRDQRRQRAICAVHMEHKSTRGRWTPSPEGIDCPVLTDPAVPTTRKGRPPRADLPRSGPEIGHFLRCCPSTATQRIGQCPGDSRCFLNPGMGLGRGVDKESGAAVSQPGFSNTWRLSPCVGEKPTKFAISHRSRAVRSPRGTDELRIHRTVCASISVAAARDSMSRSSDSPRSRENLPVCRSAPDSK